MTPPHRAFVNSFPKAGTNLLEKLLRLLGYRSGRRAVAMSSVLGRHEVAKKVLRTLPLGTWTVPIGLEVPVGVNATWLRSYVEGLKQGEYMTGHAAYSDYLDFLLGRNQIRVVQVIRDPRAILFSMAEYVVEDINAWYPFHGFLKGLDLEGRIRFLITGGYVESLGIYFSGIRQVLNRLEGWWHSANVKVIRFEDLVGPKGGGDEALQENAIAAVTHFLGLAESGGMDSLQRIKDELYGGTHTFRRGRVDSWRAAYTPQLQQLMLSEVRDVSLLRASGYVSQDGTWVN
jgi:hypothetical protein